MREDEFCFGWLFARSYSSLTHINYYPIIDIVECVCVECATAANSDKSGNLGGFHSQFRCFWVNDI